MPKMHPWRVEFIKKLVGKAKARGYERFDYATIRNFLDECAEIDRGREPKQRSGASWVLDNTTDRGIQMMMNQIKILWPECPAVSEATPLFDKPKQPIIQPADPDESFAEKLGRPEVFLECVISVKMKPGNKLDLPAVQEYLSQRELLKRITYQAHRCIHVVERWFDIHVSYETGLAKIYDALSEYPGVEDAVSKPLADFGRKTSAYDRSYA
jgi:hypothetical protein